MFLWSITNFVREVRGSGYSHIQGSFLCWPETYLGCFKEKMNSKVRNNQTQLTKGDQYPVFRVPGLWVLFSFPVYVCNVYKTNFHMKWPLLDGGMKTSLTWKGLSKNVTNSITISLSLLFIIRTVQQFPRNIIIFTTWSFFFWPLPPPPPLRFFPIYAFWQYFSQLKSFHFGV